MLIDQTLFGTVDHVAVAIERLKTFEPPEGYWGAFSGGKDSIVIKELARLSGVRIDWHYSLTTVDPPELVQFIREHHADVTVDRPKLTMWQLIAKKKMPPTRLARYCCTALKESMGTGTIITGVRWAESYQRSKRQMFEHCRKSKRRQFLHPIIDWTDADVWQFIRERKLPYCCLYDEGYNRLGCIGCSMAGGDTQRKEFERWPTYRRAYLRAFQRMLEARIDAGLPTDKAWKDPEAVMKWWLDSEPKPDENQCNLFE